MIKVAIRIRLHTPKRRTPTQRLRARLYYRKNSARIRVKRRRYLHTHRSLLKHRKLFQRFKPTWLKPHKPHAPKIHTPKVHHAPKPKVHRPHKFKVVVPKFWHPKRPVHHK